MTTGSLIWYVARSAGLVTWALLALTVVWGLVLSTRSMRRWSKPAWLLDLHRGLAGLTVVFLGIHVGSILLDTYVHFGLTDVLVPLASTWHPVAVAWGIVGLYLLVAVEVTSLLRSHIPLKVWRWVHYATLPLFATATVHGFTAGTDRADMAVIGGGVIGIVAVAWLLVLRLTGARVGSPARPVGASAPQLDRPDRPVSRPARQVGSPVSPGPGWSGDTERAGRQPVDLG